MKRVSAILGQGPGDVAVKDAESLWEHCLCLLWQEGFESHNGGGGRWPSGRVLPLVTSSSVQEQDRDRKAVAQRLVDGGDAGARHVR